MVEVDLVRQTIVLRSPLILLQDNPGAVSMADAEYALQDLRFARR